MLVAIDDRTVVHVEGVGALEVRVGRVGRRKGVAEGRPRHAGELTHVIAVCLCECCCWWCCMSV